MTDTTERELQRCSHLLAMRVPEALYRALEQEAAAVGISIPDVARMKLRTGAVVTLVRQETNGTLVRG
jgi:hypothetical protein